MKLALTTSGVALDAPLDPRFGRAPRFIIYDLDAESFETLDNAQNLNAPQGAGIQAAQTIVQSGVEALITGNCGPKAFSVLQAAGVRVYTTDATTVAEALDSYRAGRLQPATAPNVESHWG